MTIITLPAKPDALTFDGTRAAVVVNDMQNAFCSPNGYIDRIGLDISAAATTALQVKALCGAARKARIPVILMQNGFSSDFREAPGPSSPLWHKSNALRYMRAHPEAQGHILVRGTWDHALIEDLQPEPGDLVMQKATDDGFAGTELDLLLQGRDINTILVCGISSNVGVESTLRSAYHRGYFGVMVSDACMAVGPNFMQAATEFSISTFFGWVTTVDQVTRALSDAKADPTC